jgi:aminodeoxyfutalosine synthase
MEAMTVMSAEEARALLADTNLVTVGARGDEERRRRHGTRTTFVRVLEVHADAIPAALPPHARPGEIRLLGRPGSLDAAVAAVGRARVLAADVPLTAFVLSDLVDLCGGDTAKLRDLCRALRDAGLRAIADAPVDLLDEEGSAIAAARDAGLAVPRLTVYHAPSTPSKDPSTPSLAVLQKARALQARVGGIGAFAPLPRVSSVAQPSTGYDDVRQIAVARLLVDNIDRIQVDWALYGPKLAQVALTMGADDVDAVSPLEGDLGRRRSPIEEIRGNIKAAGLEAVERTAAELWNAR